METDVLVIGSGIAGAICALGLAKDNQRQITLLTRAEAPKESASFYAQGGIVSLGVEDSAKSLAKDITQAGGGISYKPAVDLLANLGPKMVKEILIDDANIPFDHGSGGEYSYGLEGGHSQRRILHVKDHTGRAIMQGLINLVEQKKNIQLLKQNTAIDLITLPHHARDSNTLYDDPICLGAYAFDQKNKRVISVIAQQTVLCTGGLGQIFLRSTNPVGARGDGVAMAYRAGARIINAEFIQFHPTVLYSSNKAQFLISEAVRGEGAELLTPDGKPFIERYAPKWKELAPRDVVARAIYMEMISNDYPFVFLDIASKKPATQIKRRFPQIYNRCLEENIDITQQPIPVVPAAHYFCGGVHVDLVGRSSLRGLYAIGEVSCTGLHGANRLASTSLLEGLVWGSQSAEHIRSLGKQHEYSEHDIRPWSMDGLIYEPDPALIQGDFKTLQNLMWHYVGLVRNDYRLKRALRDLRYLRHEIENFYNKTSLNDDLIGLRNAILTSQLVANAAFRNKKSMGAHYREDN